MTHQRDLHAYFVERVARLAADRGLKIAGWQEIALDHSPEYDAAVLPVVAAVNSWTNAGSKSSKMAGLGYPIILSNVDYLYFDQTPTTHPEEPGLVWGGIVDEFRPLHATWIIFSQKTRICRAALPASQVLSLPRPYARTA